MLHSCHSTITDPTDGVRLHLNGCYRAHASFNSHSVDIDCAVWSIVGLCAYDTKAHLRRHSCFAHRLQSPTFGCFRSLWHFRAESHLRPTTLAALAQKAGAHRQLERGIARPESLPTAGRLVGNLEESTCTCSLECALSCSQVKICAGGVHSGMVILEVTSSLECFVLLCFASASGTEAPIQ